MSLDRPMCSGPPQLQIVHSPQTHVEEGVVRLSTRLQSGVVDWRVKGFGVSGFVHGDSSGSSKELRGQQHLLPSALS